METISTPALPLPRAADVHSSYEQGRCTRGELHAARNTLNGQRALCDGRKIVSRATGRFELRSPAACPECVAAVTG